MYILPCHVLSSNSCLIVTQFKKKSVLKILQKRPSVWYLWNTSLADVWGRQEQDSRWDYRVARAYLARVLKLLRKPIDIYLHELGSVLEGWIWTYIESVLIELLQPNVFFFITSWHIACFLSSNLDFIPGELLHCIFHDYRLWILLRWDFIFGNTGAPLMTFYTFVDMYF